MQITTKALLVVVLLSLPFYSHVTKTERTRLRAYQLSCGVLAPSDAVTYYCGNGWSTVNGGAAVTIADYCLAADFAWRSSSFGTPSDGTDTTFVFKYTNTDITLSTTVETNTSTTQGASVSVAAAGLLTPGQAVQLVIGPATWPTQNPTAVNWFGTLRCYENP